MPETRLEALTDRLGFALDAGVLERRGCRFRLQTTDDPAAWRSMSWALWCARIVVDQVTSTYDVRTERTSKAPARNVYEVASRYGDRERWLLPRTILDTAERLAEKRFVRQRWVDDRFDIALGLEEGFGVHFLGAAELVEMAFDLDDVLENARLAHFYASYKARPVATEKFDDLGRLKRFHTVDGKTSSRAILFPDFDWDAAQDNGSFFLPGRDHLVTAEPFGAENADEMARRGAQMAAEQRPDIPFYPTRYQLGPKSVTPVEDAWEDPLEPVAELPLERLA